MAQTPIELVVKVSWWVLPYIHSVALFARMTGLQPDFDKAVRTALRGIRVTAK